MNTLSIEQLWSKSGFSPNENQQQAIRHIDGSLYLTAGPGSGKTRVLLWRTLNLIVFHDVKPEEIFLATFTEKAALQLKEGLRALLSIVTPHTNQSYDLGRMYVGTVHSLCQRMLTDRRLLIGRSRAERIRLMDELSQYFFLMNGRNWDSLISVMDVQPDKANPYITQSIGDNASLSKHEAVNKIIAFFGRLGEENLAPDDVLEFLEEKEPKDYKSLIQLTRLYQRYKEMLQKGEVRLTDFSLLQGEALERLNSHNDSGRIFRHIIIDEYQDTNTIQEEIFFKLASGYGNLCVVGDDDQALYRFRGATVENFVQFPARCHSKLGQIPKTIALTRNYRSRSDIVNFYNQFMGKYDWQDGQTRYRVNKTIEATRQDSHTAVVATNKADAQTCFAEIAQLARQLLDQGKVQDPNQIAFLFPSLKSEQVGRAIAALDAVGLKVYAPRAKRFLETDEAVDVFSIFVQVFGRPTRENFPGIDYSDFHNWLDDLETHGKGLLKADPLMRAYIENRKAELSEMSRDYVALKRVVDQNRWDLTAPYDLNTMRRSLYEAPGLTERARKALTNRSFEKSVEYRQKRGDAPYTLDYTLKRTTSIDWNVLDLFYRLCGFERFKTMFDLAETGQDEGPICNLGLITKYLAMFMDEYMTLIPAQRILDGSFVRLFFTSYLYALYRRGESEYEDADDPFPKGRIPFITIHQSKGLEFPVVILANPSKRDTGAQPLEQKIRPLLQRSAEPLDRVAGFDGMRMFYVALSRAKNLLVIAHIKGLHGKGQVANFKQILESPEMKHIRDLDLATVPVAEMEDRSIPRNYSFTSDYLTYEKCPRQYMVFRKYGFVASRSQTMFFGTLVHSTLEDLHNEIISRRSTKR